MENEPNGRSAEASAELARLTQLVVNGEILKEKAVLAADPGLFALVNQIYLDFITFPELDNHPAKQHILNCGKMLAEIEDPTKTTPYLKPPRDI